MQTRFGRLLDLSHKRTVARTDNGSGEAFGSMMGQFILDTALVRGFVGEIEKTLAGANSPVEACEAIRPRFSSLLVDPDWLPSKFQAPVPESRVGGGIGQWLLYRADDGSLSLFCLVGLYRGRQEEEIYRRRPSGLELVERRALGPGDFYVLIPPRDDIHRVRTTSPETSVSIHLLTNDTGCVWRNTYDVSSGEARPFRSGYVNVPSDDDRAYEGRP